MNKTISKMKNIVSRVKNSIILIAFMWSSVSLQAQVNIGSTKDPHEGAVLDLSQASGANGKGLGFLLPRVALNDANQWQIAGSSTNATGMMIYNTNANVVDGNGEGIYIWDGKIWSPVHSPSLSADVPLTAFDVTPAVTKIDVAIGASQKFSISNIIPNNASYPGVKWSITSGQSFVQIISTSMTECIVKGLKVGDAVLSIKSLDDHYITTVNVHVPAYVVGPAVEQIGNNVYNIYCYSGAGCWMTENSREGNSNSTFVSNNNHYYLWGNKDEACPSGWSVPNDTQWKALQNVLNQSGNASLRTVWNSGQALSGVYYGYQVVQETQRAYWWSDTTSPSSFDIVKNDKLTGPNTKTQSYSLTVRCIKD